MPQTDDELYTKFHNLLFGVRRSVRYHNRRRMFFDRWRMMVSAVQVICGSGAVLAVLGMDESGRIITAVIAALIAGLAAVDLVVDSARAARLHADLSRRFIDLEKRIVACLVQTEEKLIELNNARLEIEAEEPPVLRVLDMICHNEMLRAMGYGTERFAKIGFFQRQVAQFFDLREHAIRLPSQS